MRQTNYALLIYPVIGLLGLAAAMPLLNPSLVAGAADARPIEMPAARVIVSTSQPRPIDDLPPTAAPSAPAAVVASSGEDRWWRTQMDRLGTMSVVKLPNPPARPAAAQIVDRAQREAAQRDAAAQASRPPAAAAPRTFGDVRLGENVPASIRRWEPLIARAARKHDLDPHLIAALMQTESGGNPNAVSHANAIGLLQVLNGPFDPEANIDQGAAMLAGHIKRFGSLNLALAAYNAGPNAVARYGGIPPYDETYKHVTRTLASYAAFRG